MRTAMIVPIVESGGKNEKIVALFCRGIHVCGIGLYVCGMHLKS